MYYFIEKVLDSMCLTQHIRVPVNTGDTIYINKYSRVKSVSELGQGILLSIIAESKK